MSSSKEDSESIYISSITLRVPETLGQPVHRIILRTKTESFEKNLPVEVFPGQEHKEVFNPALRLSSRDQLSVSMQYRWSRIGRSLDITVEQSEIVMEARDDRSGKKTYMNTHKGILITIDLSGPTDPFTRGSSHDSLHPTTSEILRICPRFRLLIVGNSGVGKSTLINSVFGVKDVDISEASRGRADIDREFVAAENGLFVLHDSLGFEAAEGNNLARVKQFIDDRRRKEDLKERLHAVWMCLAVPYARGLLIEAGMEELLRNRREILGDIPIIVVLTKLDLLDNALIMDLDSDGVMFRSIVEARPHLDPRRSTFLNEYCTKPLRAAGGNIPHIAVSTKIGYKLEPTISELVNITTSEIERYIKADPLYLALTGPQNMERSAQLYIAGMAQRANIEAKVKLTIAIGRKNIILVWNFNDPHNVLQSDSFKEALLDTSNLGVNDSPGGQAALNDLAKIPGTFALTRFWSEGLKSAETIAKSFMTYIADLVYVMKILLILAPHGSVTSQDVLLALEVYKRSTYRNRVHLEIQDFNTNFVTGRDAVLDKIEVVIRRYSITDEDVSLLRSQIRLPPRRS